MVEWLYSHQENKQRHHKDAGADEEEHSLWPLVPGVHIVHQAMVHSEWMVTVHTERATTLTGLNSEIRSREHETYTCIFSHGDTRKDTKTYCQT